MSGLVDWLVPSKSLAASRVVFCVFMSWRCYQRLQQEEENMITEIEVAGNPHLGFTVRLQRVPL